MMTFPVLILILTGAAFGQRIQRGDRPPATLDMAEESFDDQYKGWTKAMSCLVENTHLKKALESTNNFQESWSKGEKWCSTNKKDTLGDINYCIALYVYTLLDPPIYKAFNTATRAGKTQYTFQWYSLHFYLTRAVQVLKDREKEKKIECITVYRGVGFEYEKMSLKNEVRFGCFSSSSLNRKVAEDFGKVTCFEINTCYGASIIEYSANPAQEEVLIPPYETFNVTKVSEKINNPGLWCNTVYELKSSGIKRPFKSQKCGSL